MSKASPSGVDTEDIDRYLSLHGMKLDLSAKMEAVKEEMDNVASRILEQFIDSGTAGIKREDGVNVHLKKQIFASRLKGMNPVEFNEILKKNGLEYLVKEQYSASKLSALVRELDSEGQELPEAVEKVVKIHERFSLGVHGYK